MRELKAIIDRTVILLPALTALALAHHSPVWPQANSLCAGSTPGRNEDAHYALNSHGPGPHTCMHAIVLRQFSRLTFFRSQDVECARQASGDLDPSLRRQRGIVARVTPLIGFARHSQCQERDHRLVAPMQLCPREAGARRTLSPVGLKFLGSRGRYLAFKVTLPPCRP